MTIEFFLPFEFDNIPQDWDPWNDTWRNDKKKYIWECFDKPPFDGLLISKARLDLHLNYFKNLTDNKDLKNLLNLASSIKLFGDCGAFQYRNEKKPPYSVEEVLDYYQDYGFDMGCSIDHIITNKKDIDLRTKRYNLTKRLAKECLKHYSSKSYTFELFGVAQGWDIESYKSSVIYLKNIGYENICIGGLVGVYKQISRTSNDLTLVNLIKQLAPILKKFKKVHIFGRGNLDLIKLYIESGITQFDYNLMRKSWTDEKRSYQIFNKTKKKSEFYTSIRIRLIKRKMGITPEEIGVFDKLQDFENKIISSEELISTLKEYNNFYRTFKLKELSKQIKTSNKTKLIEKYNYYKKNHLSLNIDLIHDLLEDKPWNICDCELCREAGIHICVFRRRIRNLRRAFHNVYNYFLALDHIKNNQ